MIVLDLISMDGAWPVLGPVSGDDIARIYDEHSDRGRRSGLYRHIKPNLWAAIARTGEHHE